jgi:hypothetical protein
MVISVLIGIFSHPDVSGWARGVWSWALDAVTGVIA